MIIGLEIHGYLQTKEKLFCTCKAIHGAKNSSPNTHICPICTGQPGAKPMLPNSEAIKKIIQIASILNCHINPQFAWQRKHYDWPDLPKGFQTTISGTHAIPVGIQGTFEKIKIREVHLEEDPAAWNPKTGAVDYNRSGTPLVEIVTEPEFTSSEQVFEWLKKLILTLDYIKAIDKSLGIKADVNISLPEKNGARIEIKNVNSLNNIKSVIEYEFQRQTKETPKTEETRRYNEAANTTSKMRSKEEAQDYRFLSEPDLPVIQIKKETIAKIKADLPETPQEKLNKLIKKHKVPQKQAEVLSKNLDIVEIFEQAIAKIKNKNLAISWTTIELPRILNYNKISLDDPKISFDPTHFIELLELIEKKVITELKAKQILNQFIPKSFSPKEHAKSHSTISDDKEIENIAKQVIKENSKAVEDYKAGNQNTFNFLVGQVMSKSNRRADYKTAREVLKGLLK